MSSTTMRGCSLMSATQRPLVKHARKPKPNARQFAPAGRDDGFAVPGSATTSAGSAKTISGWSRSPGPSSAARPRREQRKTLVTALDELVRKPSPIGAMIESQGDPAMASPVGILTNGGVWPSINGTLIWALAMADGALAWDEWKKNSLAMHAEAYPEIWYGIWSGPDYLQLGAIEISRADHVRRSSISRSQDANGPGIQLDRLSSYEYASPRLAALQRGQAAGPRISRRRGQLHADIFL